MEGLGYGHQRVQRMWLAGNTLSLLNCTGVFVISKIIICTRAAGIHYENVSSLVTIAPTGRPCTDVPIIDNEDYDVGGRDFSGTLYSNDPSVQITADSFTVHIDDNDGR